MLGLPLDERPHRQRCAPTSPHLPPTMEAVDRVDLPPSSPSSSASPPFCCPSSCGSCPCPRSCTTPPASGAPSQPSLPSPSPSTCWCGPPFSCSPPPPPPHLLPSSPSCLSSPPPSASTLLAPACAPSAASSTLPPLLPHFPYLTAVNFAPVWAGEGGVRYRCPPSSPASASAHAWPSSTCPSTTTPSLNCRPPSSPSLSSLTCAYSACLPCSLLSSCCPSLRCP